MPRTYHWLRFLVVISALPPCLTIIKLATFSRTNMVVTASVSTTTVIVNSRVSCGAYCVRSGCSSFQTEEAVGGNQLCRIMNEKSKPPNFNGGFWKKIGPIYENVTCESEQMVLQCAGGAINIMTSYYGYIRVFAQCAGPVEAKNCSIQAVDKLQTTCQGKGTCSLTVNNDAFGKDPCTNTKKYLYTTYMCD